MSNDRFFAFFGENRASLAMDIKTTDEANNLNLPQKELTFALAFCNHRDDFNKKIARDILNGRLNAAQDESREEPVRLVFKTTYLGNHPKRDVMGPLLSGLRQLPKDREHSEITGLLQDLFLDFRHDGVQRIDAPENEAVPA